MNNIPEYLDYLSDNEVYVVEDTVCELIDFISFDITEDVISEGILDWPAEKASSIYNKLIRKPLNTNDMKTLSKNISKFKFITKKVSPNDLKDRAKKISNMANIEDKTFDNIWTQVWKALVLIFGYTTSLKVGYSMFGKTGGILLVVFTAIFIISAIVYSVRNGASVGDVVKNWIKQLTDTVKTRKSTPFSTYITFVNTILMIVFYGFIATSTFSLIGLIFPPFQIATAIGGIALFLLAFVSMIIGGILALVIFFNSIVKAAEDAKAKKLEAERN